MKRFACVTLFALAAMSAARANMAVNIGGAVSGGAVVGGTTYTDNEAGVDSNPASGLMDIGTFLNGIAANFVIQGFTATSGSPLASMSLNTNAILSPSATLPLSLNILITDTGFTSPSEFVLAQTVNLLSSTGGDTASASAIGYYGASNTEFDVAGSSTAAALGTVLTGVGANSPGLSGAIAGATPYSLTSAVHVEIAARGSDPVQSLEMNANLDAQTIPEPATQILIGGALLLAPWLMRRRNRASSRRS